jgi:hypothetical protein
MVGPRLVGVPKVKSASALPAPIKIAALNPINNTIIFELTQTLMLHLPFRPSGQENNKNVQFMPISGSFLKEEK